MKIREFIRQSFEKRADAAGALVIYDAERCFRDIVKEMASDRCSVIDATESIIEAQEIAVERWASAGEARHSESKFVVYIPGAAPRTDEERCHDPFAAIAAGSDWFPRTDDDKFQNLCERAKPDFREKIHDLFASGVPDLTTLEAVGAGNNWPQLQTLLGVESAAEILSALLAPTVEQETRMKGGDAWVVEARELALVHLGFVPKTKSKKWDAFCDELWRLILFSEFAFDLPQGLPESLVSVPIAKSGSKNLLKRVCEVLRSERHYARYIERADATARELALEERVRHIEDLGELDTFAFEERSFLRQYVKCVLAGEFGRATEIAAKRQTSVWVKYTDRGMLWTVAVRARELMVVADDLERDLHANAISLNDLLAFYTSRGYRLDQVHREMERAVADAFGEVEGLENLIEPARVRFQSVADKMQRRLVEKVEKEGWPASGRVRATQIFDRYAAPLLETRSTRTVVFFVDAFRFELAVSLERQLSMKYVCRLGPACAQLPTITPVGMAALLPKADGNLHLRREGEELVPTLGGKPIRNPQERFAYVRDLYGDRARMVDLDALLVHSIGGKKKSGEFENVELLLVKTTDIDEQGELDAGNVRDYLPHILQKLIAAIGKVKKLGFHHAVLSADHGFVLLSETAAGSVANKPTGDWLKVKDRCLLGSGSANPETILFAREHVGISGDFQSYVVPRAFGTFSKRTPYFHEGLSLPECVLPVLEVELGKEEAAGKTVIDVQLRYRGETAGTITTQRPVIEITVFGGELFSTEVAFRLEAGTKTGDGEEVVGEAASSPFVDPASGVVKVKTGQAIKVPLRINEDFRGAMDVRAVDAETGVIYGLPLKLKTGYLD